MHTFIVRHTPFRKKIFKVIRGIQKGVVHKVVARFNKIEVILKTSLNWKLYVVIQRTYR